MPNSQASIMVEPSLETTSFSPGPAPFGRRFLAKLVDLLLVDAFCGVLLIGFAVLQADGIPGTRLVFWLLGVFLLFGILYLAVGTSGGRQTLGYRLAGLRVVLAGSGDVPIEFSRSLGRSVLDWVSYGLMHYLIGLADYVAIFVTPQKQALHDLATKTRVIAATRPHYPALAACAVLGFAIPFALVFGLVRPFLMQSFYAPSPSMAPTLPEDTHFLVNKLVYRLCLPQRGDIVAFHAPASAASYLSAGDDYVKRIVGLPGEDLRIARGKVVIYGKGTLREPYIAMGYSSNLPQPESEDSQDDWFEKRRSSLVRHGGVWWIRVPAEQYFVLGDNRNDSNDSHVWGFLPRGNIVGKVTLVYSPRFEDL